MFFAFLAELKSFSNLLQNVCERPLPQHFSHLFILINLHVHYA